MRFPKLAAVLYLSVVLAAVKFASLNSNSGTRRDPAARPSCPTQVTIPKNFTPEQVKELASQTEVKSVEDMLACLARDLELKVMLVHTSTAAQNSDSGNPRALAFAYNENKRIHGAFTVNSGEPHLVQGQSVEFMFNNVKSKELEYYDIEFAEGHGVMSPPNPEFCLNCHGSGGVLPVGGPKPLFDRQPWARIVLAGSSFSPQNSDRDLCPNRRKAHFLLERQAISAFEKKPRYQALQGRRTADIDDIDLQIRLLNTRRIAKWISQTPDYEKFKYSIFGAAYFCMHDAESWFPQKVLSQMTNMAALSPAVQAAKDEGDLEAFRLASDISYWKENAKIDQANVSLLADLKAGKPVIFGLPTTDREGACVTPYQIRNGEIQEDQPLRPQMDKYIEGRGANGAGVFRRYFVDTSARHGDPGLHAFRFLFESRGLDISDWDTSLFPGYGRTPDSLYSELLALEPEGSPDFQLLQSWRREIQNIACPRLRDLSFKHLSQAK